MSEQNVDNQQVDQEQNATFEVDDYLPEVPGLLPEELALMNDQEADSGTQSNDDDTGTATAEQEAAAAAQAAEQEQANQPATDTLEQPQQNELENISIDLDANKTLLEDAQAQKTQLHTDLTELGKKFDAGEIGQGEYDAQKVQLQDKLDDVKADIRQFNDRSKQLESNYTTKQSEMQQSYEKTVTDWLSRPENSGVFIPNTAAFAMLDVQIRTISQSIPDISITEALDRARKATFEVLGLENNMPAGAQKPKQEVKQQEVKPKRGETEIPATLADMNSSEQNTLGEFGHIDKLSGLAYESALAALPADARQRYLNG